jgi:hypothetical protein
MRNCPIYRSSCYLWIVLLYSSKTYCTFRSPNKLCSGHRIVVKSGDLQRERSCSESHPTGPRNRVNAREIRAVVPNEEFW